jgi:hypothetical protein
LNLQKITLLASSKIWGAASLGRKKLQHDIVVSKIMRIFGRLIMNKLLILHIYETETKLREHGSIG